ncbi:ABC transporter [Paenibacillus sp. J31TS4]|uniref:sugar ABC transporter ATP-binding protein n=1 Tax=Paenibacillus sp. J31TS4 TaxID=2807195 RepID=UPI001B115A34|nr:sugar ABC transporter ATP-binding protein [Paenibacillus sp. J31TS4]GIP37956.1 ABC transporter [Paenibacillus sp. J31TS4]
MTKTQEPLLAMKGIRKAFPGVLALKDVDFELRAGEIHGLLGANGAGKSTLMKVLAGAYTADEGELVLNGERLTWKEPSDAIRHGIHCVYQEVDTALVPQADLAENVFLDRIASGSRWIRWARLRREAAGLLASLGLERPVDTKAADLTIAEKQLVLLARALANDAKVIVFDEPTAPLGLEETKRLFERIRSVRDAGVGCVFISHRLAEVFELCDRLTVMRDGGKVTTLETTETDSAEVVRLMLGKPFEEEYPKRIVPIGETLLEVRGLKRGSKVKDVSFELRRGEILGIVGLVGAGKTELSRLLFGADPADAGEIRLGGRPLRLGSPADAIRAGIVLVPEERRRQGVFVEESLADNLTLPSLGRVSSFGFVRRSEARELAGRLIAQLGITPARQEHKVKWLSGGNQQKAAVGKWLPTDAEVFLFDEPTKGVDVGAKSDMFRLMGRLAAQGKGIVYLTGELAEAIGIADRILVLSYGSVVRELPAAEATAELILSYASAGEAR